MVKSRDALFILSTITHTRFNFPKELPIIQPTTGSKLFDGRFDLKFEVIMRVGDDVERSDGVVVSS